MPKLQLGVFASGRGSNFAAIYQAIQDGRLDAEVRLLLSNNPSAGALDYAQQQGISTAVVYRSQFETREAFVHAMLEALETHGVQFIALAGYMKKIPEEVIDAFANRIANIHPALLPSFGGKGMYGHFVHEAVLAHGCKVSGATVHLVDRVYDRGPIVAQGCVPVQSNDTPDSLAARVLEQEHQIFPEALQWFAEDRITIRDRVVHISD